MENEVASNYVNHQSEIPTVPPSWRALTAPLFGVGLAWLFWSVFGLNHFNAYGPGVGVPVFLAAYYAIVLLMLGRRARFGAAPAALMAASLVLAVCCALYALPGFMALNCLAILLLAAMATFSLSGQNLVPLRRAAVLPETVRLSVLALFSRVAEPFRVMRQRGENRRGAFGVTAVSVLVAIPVLAVVLALLGSADTVFGSLFSGVADWFGRLDAGTFLWRLIRVLVLAVFLSSGLYFLLTPPGPAASASRSARTAHTLPFLLVTVLLDAVYLLFCAVQLRYLFGGAETAAMAGGWAEYARTGFFQLVAVAVINLTLCLLASGAERYAAKGGFVLRLADGLMLLLTAVILASAARRMQLYILAFGLSVLRLMTLWGMLVIAVGILAGGWKLLRPDFCYFAVAGGFALGTWCLLCLCSPGGLIADYNVDQYLSGQLESVDTDYLQSLTTDALPALKRLAAADPLYADEVSRIHSSFACQTAHSGGWSQWKLSFQSVDYSAP